MTTTKSLNAKVRDGSGKGVARRLRQAGRVPAVLYGKDMEAVSLSIDAMEAGHLFAGISVENTIIDIQVEGESEPHQALVREVQAHPHKKELIHVDFLLIDRDAPLSVEVPVVLIGEADKVENEKGIVDQILYTLQINAKPDAIPNELELDISDLEIGSTLTVGDISLPPGVTTDLDADDPVATGSMTRSALVEETAVEGEEGAEGAEGEGAEGEGADGEGAEASEGGDEG